MLFVITLFYASYKFEKLVNISDYKVMESQREDFYADVDVFNASHGFQVAATVTAFDGSPETVLDPSYGSLRFVMKSWEGSEYGENGLFRNLASRECMMEEFNGINEIDDDGLNFFRPTTSARSDIETYGPKMLCLKNDDDFSMWGNYNSAHA